MLTNKMNTQIRQAVASAMLMSVITVSADARANYNGAASGRQAGNQSYNNHQAPSGNRGGNSNSRYMASNFGSAAARGQNNGGGMPGHNAGNPPAAPRTNPPSTPRSTPPSTPRTPVSNPPSTPRNNPPSTPRNNPPSVPRNNPPSVPRNNPPNTPRTPVSNPPRGPRNEPGRFTGMNHGGDVIHGHRPASIPAEHFRSHFGREHHFRMEHVTMVSGHPHFYHDGFRFGVVGVWPASWMYSDAVFVDNIGGAYYLCNPRFPGAMLPLNVADPSAADNGDDQQQQTSDADTVTVGQTIGQVVAALGYPQSIVDMGWKKIYLYPNMKLTFVAGRLAEVR